MTRIPSRSMVVYIDIPKFEVGHRSQHLNSSNNSRRIKLAYAFQKPGFTKVLRSFGCRCCSEFSILSRHDIVTCYSKPIHRLAILQSNTRAPLDHLLERLPIFFVLVHDGIVISTTFFERCLVIFEVGSVFPNDVASNDEPPQS